MTRKKIVVLASGQGSNLSALIAAAQPRQYQVAAVFSDKPQARALTIAQENNIDAHCIEPKTFTNQTEYEHKLAEAITDYQPDLIVLAGFMRILKQTFLDYFPNQIINLHPSLLPKHKGLHTHQQAKTAGDKYHGASVHVVTSALDGGPVLLRGKIPMPPGDIAEIAHAVQKIEHKILPLAVQLILKNKFSVHHNQLFFNKIPLSLNGLTLAFSS